MLDMHDVVLQIGSFDQSVASAAGEVYDRRPNIIATVSTATGRNNEDPERIERQFYQIIQVRVWETLR